MSRNVPSQAYFPFAQAVQQRGACGANTELSHETTGIEFETVLAICNPAEQIG